MSQIAYFHVKPKMLAILHLGGATQQVFTTEQIVHFIGQYIEKKKLYDPQNKRIINCKDDLLGEVFQLEQFVVGEFRSLWKCIVPYVSLAYKKELPENQETDKDESSTSQDRSNIPASQLPWWFFINRKSNTDDSLNTGTCLDFGDTIVAYDTDYDSEAVQTEYEPVDESDDSDDTVPVSISSDDDDIFDDINCLKNCFSTDDSSSDGTSISDCYVDPEIGFDEWWSCHECQTKNSPIVGYCMRCWKLRKGWAGNEDSLKRSITEPLLSSKNSSSQLSRSVSLDVTEGVLKERNSSACDSTPIDFSQSFQSTINPTIPDFTLPLKRKLNDEALSEGNSKSISLDDKKKPHLDSSNNLQVSSPMSATTSTSTATSSSEPEGYPGLCNMCRNSPNDSVLVHGRTGHQFCCYRCAKRLQKKGKSCPVCRGEILLVVRNHHCQL